MFTVCDNLVVVHVQCAPHGVGIVVDAIKGVSEFSFFTTIMITYVLPSDYILEHGLPASSDHQRTIRTVKSGTSYWLNTSHDCCSVILYNIGFNS